MDTIQIGIINLLKSAVTQEKQQIPSGFDLATSYPVIQKHHIFPLIYDGAVRCGFDRKAAVMNKLFRAYVQILQISEKQMQQVDSIYEAFERNGIDYMPLKGCKMKSLYPRPELRVMGDADILIRVAQYDKIVPILTSFGMVEGEESDHELNWSNDSLQLELHKRITPSFNTDLYMFLGDGWSSARLNQGTCYSMSNEDEYLYLFTHFTRHYRGGGIGCRHLVDLWMYLRTHPELDDNYIADKIDGMNLREFHENIRRTIAVWFEDATADVKTDYITDYIFSCGSWGVIENYAFAIALRAEQKNNEKMGKINYILQRVFPPLQELKGRYPILETKPYMLPVVWVRRLSNKLLFESESISRQCNFVSKLDDDALDARRQSLQYVGLEFN